MQSQSYKILWNCTFSEISPSHGNILIGLSSVIILRPGHDVAGFTRARWWCSRPEISIFFYKAPNRKYSVRAKKGFEGLKVYCNNSTLQLHQESSHRQEVNKWMWLHYHKTIFIKKQVGLDTVDALWARKWYPRHCFSYGIPRSAALITGNLLAVQILRLPPLPPTVATESETGAGVQQLGF